MMSDVPAAVLLLIYAGLASWTLCSLSTSWPHAGSWLYLSLLLLCPGILFQSVRMIFTKGRHQLPWKGNLIRLVTIPAGLLLAVALSNFGSERAMAGFERAYAPFAATIRANMTAPCGTYAGLFEDADIAAYNKQTRASRGTRAAATLYRDEHRFVLAFAGRSIDIDGSTFYYDSSAYAWHRFHNDDSKASAEFAGLVADLDSCILQESGTK